MDTKLIPLNQQVGSIQGNISSPVYQVRIKKVEKVEEFDFPQARKTWEALVDAGMDPGELVANGLSVGHGYEVSENIMIAPIRSNETAEILGESQTTDELLLGYKYSSETLENIDTKLLTSTSEEGLILVSQNLTVQNGPQQVKTVDLTAIAKNQTPQLNSSNSEQKKIE